MNLLVMGESLSLKKENKNSWVEIVKAKAHVKLFNKTANNCEINEIIAKLNNYAKDLDPKTIFIICGTEDALANKTAHHIFKNVTEVINKCTDKGISAIVILQPFFNVDICKSSSNRSFEDLNNALITLKRYRRLIEDYCFEENIGIIDFEKAFIETDFKTMPEKYFIDGIHLTDYAHEMIAEKFIYKYNHILSKENKKTNSSNININININTAK